MSSFFPSVADTPDLSGKLVTVLGSDADPGIQTEPSKVQVDGRSSTDTSENRHWVLVCLSR